MKKIKIFFSAMLFSLISTIALADFDWKKYAGKKLYLHMIYILM